MAKTVGLYTLGCKLNYAETDALSRSLTEQGYTHVAFSGVADYYIVNSCSVTESANKKVDRLFVLRIVEIHNQK